jgi:metal-responsive CopG/Arc/MetJ family transcriptional regulator
MPASLLALVDQIAAEEHEDRSGFIRRCIIGHLRQIGRLPVPVRSEVVS